MLKICFMDTARWDYDVDTPFQRPIGGSQSAMIYLAIELATRGHTVALATHGTSPGTKRGVVCVGANPGFSAEFLAQFDVVVVLNSALPIEQISIPFWRTISARSCRVARRISSLVLASTVVAP